MLRSVFMMALNSSPPRAAQLFASTLFPTLSPDPWNSGDDPETASDAAAARASAPSQETNIKAVEAVSWDIPIGGHTIVVGRSGSGNSTRVQLLQRCDDPTPLQVTPDGQPVAHFTLDSLRKSVISMSQKNQLL